jgi:hypothetical protein
MLFATSERPLALCKLRTGPESTLMVFVILWTACFAGFPEIREIPAWIRTRYLKLRGRTELRLYVSTLLPFYLLGSYFIMQFA